MKLRALPCKTWIAGLLLLPALLLAGPRGQAGVAVLEADRLLAPAARLEAVRLTLDWPDDAGSGRLRFEAALLDTGELGYRWQDLDWGCELEGPAPQWRCAGTVRARGQGRQVLEARLGDDGLVVQLGAGAATGRVRVTQPTADPAPTQLELLRVPVAWLAPLFEQLWPEGALTDGRLDASWQIRDLDDALELGGSLQTRGLGVDSRAGDLAAAGIDASGQVRLRLTDTDTSVATELAFTAGEWLVGPMYAAFPEHPVRLDARFRSGTGERWQVDLRHWSDPGTLELSGELEIDMAAGSALQGARLAFEVPQLQQARARYFDTLLAAAGWPQLDGKGALQGQLHLVGGDWRRLDLDFGAVDIVDGEGSFALHGLDGDLKLRWDDTEVSSRLAWQGAALYGLTLGGADIELASRGGGLRLRAPARVPLFGGTLELRQLQHAIAPDGPQVDLSMELQQVDLGALSAALGWPAFSGTVSGSLPRVHMAGERIDFEGGLSADLFGGQVRVEALSMERPFGVAPMLAASLEFSGLDLGPLTGAFGFGEITGRMDGHVRGLRLLDWEPVAFDANLRTVRTPGQRQRISQRAVRDLTEVGGGGIAGGLQAQVLKAFSSFGYARIGLSCVLSNNVCRMGGAGPASDGGYVIVEGSGLPRVNVIGHQHQVDWPILLARLKAATEGQVPVID